MRVSVSITGVIISLCVCASWFNDCAALYMYVTMRDSVSIKGHVVICVRHLVCASLYECDFAC